MLCVLLLRQRKRRKCVLLSIFGEFGHIWLKNLMESPRIRAEDKNRKYVSVFIECWSQVDLSRKFSALLLSLNPQFLHPVSEGAGFHLQDFSSTANPINFPPGFIEDMLDMLLLHLVKTSHLIWRGRRRFVHFDQIIGKQKCWIRACDNRSFNHISQFAYIPRPVVRHKLLHELLGYFFNFLTHVSTYLWYKILNQ